jgi:hypothetical protein
VAASLPEAPKTPLLLSALGPAAFRLAGALSDGAISWMAPMLYLLDVALPNLQAGADEARRPQPPLIAHVPVALGDDPAAVRAAAQGALDYFRTLPAYVSMFTAAGLFDGPEEEAAARLATMLIVAGDEVAVAARLRDLLATEIDELLVTTLPVADEAAERRRLIRCWASSSGGASSLPRHFDQRYGDLHKLSLILRTYDCLATHRAHVRQRIERSDNATGIYRDSRRAREQFKECLTAYSQT